MVFSDATVKLHNNWSNAGNCIVGRSYSMNDTFQPIQSVVPVAVADAAATSISIRFLTNITSNFSE